MGLFKNVFKARDKPKDLFNDNRHNFFFGRTTSGKVVNERTAMQTTAVYACVRILSESVAGLPIHVYRHRTDGSKERYTQHSY
jgi:phage portal protein BeeE